MDSCEYARNKQVAQAARPVHRVLFMNEAEVFKLLHKRTIIKDGHWLWRGVSYHGKISIDKKSYLVHRLALSIRLSLDYDDNSWQANHNDSVCGIRNCWNPDHLYKGTQKENIKDTVKSKTHCNANKTHCPRGHEYNEKNTYVDLKGFRCCRACWRDNYRKRSQK